MDIQISLLDIQQLNQIRDYLTSSDEESVKLGISLLKEYPLISSRLKDLCYKTKKGKVIPIRWFLRAAMGEFGERTLNSYGELVYRPSALINIVEDILKGTSERFYTLSSFRFNGKFDFENTVC